MAGEGDRFLAHPFHEATIPGDHIGLVIHEIVAEAGAQMTFGHGHANGGGDALPKRARRRLDACGIAMLGMAGGGGVKLAEIADVVHRHALIASEVQERVDEHGAMPCREDEPVPVCPVRRGWIELEKLRKQDRCRIGHAQRQAHMAALCRFHGIHGQGADGVCHILVADRSGHDGSSIDIRVINEAASGEVKSAFWTCVKNTLIFIERQYRNGQGLVMSEIDNATGELEIALGRLEAGLDELFRRTGNPELARREADALRLDRARLAETLDASRAREKQLEALADEASQALGAAIAEVRAALQKL